MKSNVHFFWRLGSNIVNTINNCNWVFPNKPPKLPTSKIAKQHINNTFFIYLFIDLNWIGSGRIGSGTSICFVFHDFRFSFVRNNCVVAPMFRLQIAFWIQRNLQLNTNKKLLITMFNETARINCLSTLVTLHTKKKLSFCRTSISTVNIVQYTKF